jgi:hypothetical protein
MVRHPLHFGCVLALQVTCKTRMQMQVSVARDVCSLGPGCVQRGINPERQFGCARAWAQPKWKHCFVNSVARVPACLAGSRGFDSRTKRQINAAVAQLVERRPEEPGVESSNSSCAPMATSNFPTCGHPKFPQARRLDYEGSGVMARRAAASLSR